MDRNNKKNDVSERQLIEEYLKRFCIEEILDETVNNIIEQRPLNPFLEMARLIESKSIPEILNISISTTILSGCRFGLEATIFTNLGESKGHAVYPHNQSVDSALFLKDFGNTVTDILKNITKVDPKDLKQMDKCLSDTIKDDPTLLLALSIACCQAAAKFKGISVYKYISEISETEMCIPIPVPCVMIRNINNSHVRYYTLYQQLVQILM